MRLVGATKCAAARLLVFALPLVPFLGCSFLLPRSEERVEVEWESFEEAKASYNRIVEDLTTEEELRTLGFSPDTTANARRLSYLELVRVLVPIGPLAPEDLPDPIRRCIAARGLCRGVEIRVSVRKRTRLGFWLLDALGFRQQERTRGWDLSASLVLVSDVVVYKTWSGTPDVNQYSDRIRPLGPLQEPFSLLLKLLEL